MAISGDLSALNLTELFQTLSQSGQQGTLTIADGPRAKRFVFTERGITLETSEDQFSNLGDILVARGALTPADLKRAEAVAQQKKLALEEAMVDAGVVERSAIDQALRTQVEEEMYDVFGWPEATFEFLPGSIAPPGGAAPKTRMLFNVSGVLMEAARRLDEWKMIHADIPGLAAVVRLTGPLDATAFEGVRRTAVPLIDGTRTVGELCTEGHLPKFDICKFLQELVKEGKAAVATPEELGAIAGQELEKGNAERALGLMRLALGQNPELHNLRLALAETLESTGRAGEAAAQYTRLAEVKLAQGDAKTAAQILTVACELAPDDDRPKAKLFEVQVHNTAVLGIRPAELRRKWTPWIRHRASHGDARGAIQALDELLEEAPDQLELWTLKSQLSKDAGDTDGAVAALRAQLPLLEAARDQSGIQRVCNSILALDPGEPEASRRLAEIQGEVPAGEAKERAAKRGFALKAFLVVVLIAGAGGAIGWREFQARGALNSARGIAEGLAQGGQYTEAAAALRDAAAEWPWTLAAGGIEVEALRYESEGRQAGREQPGK
jgi:predicted TPR repeat methyltransferase